MRILVSSINFAPDHAGIGVYSTDFPVYLAERGDKVTVVTGFPYYPQWVKPDNYRRKLFQVEEYKGMRILRGYLYVPKQVSTLRRIVHELSFSFFAGINAWRAGRHQAIVIFTPPFSLGMVGVLMKWLWACPLIINVQDLPLDAALSLGMMRPSPVSRIMGAIEAWIFRQADLVVTISPQMLQKVRAKGVSAARLALVPNWIDTARSQHPGARGNFRRQHPELAGKFVVAYAGNLGIKQGVDLLLRLAKRKEGNSNLHFCIIGDGADKPRLLSIAAELGVRNLTFMPFLAPTEYIAMLDDVQVFFVAQRSGAGNNFFPSKLLGLMAQSKPMLVAADMESELAVVVRNAGCGLVCAYGDIDAMDANLETFLSADLAVYGEFGRRKVMEYDRAHVLARWREAILRL